MKQCPKCKSKNLRYYPWLGQIWECKKCGYYGPLVLEHVDRKVQTKKSKRSSKSKKRDRKNK